MDFGIIIAAGFVTALAFVGIMYYLLFNSAPEN